MIGRFFTAFLSVLGIKRISPVEHEPPRDKMPCPKCGETIKSDAKICRFCGFRIISGTTNLIVAGTTISSERRD